MKAHFVTHIPKIDYTTPFGNRFTATVIERIVLLRAFSKSHGYELGLAEAKTLVELNSKAIITVHDFVEFMQEIVFSRKQEPKVL